jgi:glyoxylase I family protein
MYEGLHHVALIVHDLDKAKQFYGEILGFLESQDRPNFDFDGIWYHIGSTELHLVVPRVPKALGQKDGHFAIRVTNMNEVLERLEQYNWKYDSYPESITGWHQVFVIDPEGHRIEFNAKKGG